MLERCQNKFITVTCSSLCQAVWNTPGVTFFQAGQKWIFPNPLNKTQLKKKQSKQNQWFFLIDEANGSRNQEPEGKQSEVGRWQSGAEGFVLFPRWWSAKRTQASTGMAEVKTDLAK